MRCRKKLVFSFVLLKNLIKSCLRFQIRSTSLLNSLKIKFFFTLCRIFHTNLISLTHVTSYLANYISKFFLCVRGKLLSKWLITSFHGTFTIVFIRSIFLPSIHSTATDRSFTQYILCKRAHQADQWHRRAHYFYEYQTRWRMK